MAQVWQRLADDYADAVASLFPIPATELPVAQQQQQIQPKDELSLTGRWRNAAA